MTTSDNTGPELDELEAAAAAERKAAVERGGKRWAIGIVVAIVAVVGFLVTRNVHTTPTGHELSNDAKRACQEQFIPDRLKAPATAKYSGVTVSMPNARSYGDEYTVTGSVDSENSFSALVRSTFTCVVHSSGDQWVLVSATVS